MHNKFVLLATAIEVQLLNHLQMGCYDWIKGPVEFSVYHSLRLLLHRWRNLQANLDRSSGLNTIYPGADGWKFIY